MTTLEIIWGIFLVSVSIHFLSTSVNNFYKFFKEIKRGNLNLKMSLEKIFNQKKG